MKLHLAIALLAGCLTQPAPPHFDDAAIEMACTDQARAICAVRTACTYQDFSIKRIYGDAETCVARGALTCISNLHVTDTVQTPDHVEACAQAYPSDSCSAFFDGNPPVPCVTLAGPGANGSPCATLAQCASTFCSVPNHATCGTCQPLPGVGASCTYGGDCGRDLACVIPSGATTGTCTAFAGAGMACLTGAIPCEATTVCIGDDATAGTMGTCMPGVRTVGGACDTARKSPTCDGTYGLACIVTTSGSTIGTCQPIQFAAPGDPCGTIGSGAAKKVFDCGAGGACAKGASGPATCVAAAADGEACALDATIGPPCQSPATCVVGADGMTGTCVISDPAACF